MRYVLVALAAVSCLGACRRAPGPTTPANQAPAASYQAAADDELGFLAVDADFVLGLNMAQLRGSQLWHAFEPQIDALTRKFQDVSPECSADFTKQLERVTIAIKVRDRDKFSGVVVMRGGDMKTALACSVAEVKKKGGTATVDRGVTITNNPTMPGVTGAAMIVGGSTMVMQFDQGAGHDTLRAILDSGAPLRKSSVFMRMFDRRERGASLWGMANGNSPAFRQLAQSGMAFKAVDGTVVVTDRVTLAVRMTMGSPSEAAQMDAEFQKLKGPAGGFVERFESRTNNEMVLLDVAVTEPQLRNMLSMLGGVMGP